MSGRNHTNLMTLAAMSAVLIGALRSAPIAAQTSVHDRYLRAREQLIDEQLPQALEAFRGIVSQSPDADEADDAQYYVGYVLERMGRTREAAAAFDELLRRWPNSSRTSNARRRLAVLRGQDPDPGVRNSVYVVLDGDAPWEVKRETAMALARTGDFSGAAILQQMVERESGSRQIELMRVLAPHATNPAALRIIGSALEKPTSTSVKLEALAAIKQHVDRPEVAPLVGGVLERKESSSVQQQAVQILMPHVDVGVVRSALVKGLTSSNSGSVQMLTCQALAGHMLEPEVRPAVLALFKRNSSSSVQLKALEGLESSKDDPAVADLLRAAADPQNSASVEMKAMQIAGASSRSSVRAAVKAGLVSGVSTSVQLEAVKGLDSGSNDPVAAEALRDLFQLSGISTSVQIAALHVLPRHLGAPAGPEALAESLDASRSTSVLLLAVRLAADHTDRPNVRQALVELLGASGTSTSVQVEAITAMAPLSADAVVRRVIATALKEDNSTSVQLQAINALESTADKSDVQTALIAVLDPAYSTSVVLASLSALSDQVRSSREVRNAFLRTMENSKISSSARIQSAKDLLDGASGDEKGRIADAMEDVVIRISRQQWGDWTRDAIEEALKVVEAVDPARADALRQRYVRGRGEGSSTVSLRSVERLGDVREPRTRQVLEVRPLQLPVLQIRPVIRLRPVRSIRSVRIGRVGRLRTM